MVLRRREERLFSQQDTLWVESLARQDQEMLRRRNEYMGRHTEIIQFNYGRGMSRKTLVAKYGEAAVTLAIGAVPLHKGTDECPSGTAEKKTPTRT